MMDQFPTLYTKRLKLRKLQIEDVPFLIESANNKKIADRIVNIPHPYGEPDAVFRIRDVVQGFKKKSKFAFVITFIEDGTFLGEITIIPQASNGEIAYWIGEPNWNQGIATEAINTILKFGFKDIGLQNIYANTNIDNIASQKALARNGFHSKKINEKILQFEIAHVDFEQNLNK